MIDGAKKYILYFRQFRQIAASPSLSLPFLSLSPSHRNLSHDTFDSRRICRAQCGSRDYLLMYQNSFDASGLDGYMHLANHMSTSAGHYRKFVCRSTSPQEKRIGEANRAEIRTIFLDIFDLISFLSNSLVILLVFSLATEHSFVQN